MSGSARPRATDRRGSDAARRHLRYPPRTRRVAVLGAASSPSAALLGGVLLAARLLLGFLPTAAAAATAAAFVGAFLAAGLLRRGLGVVAVGLRLCSHPRQRRRRVPARSLAGRRRRPGSWRLGLALRRGLGLGDRRGLRLFGLTGSAARARPRFRRRASARLGIGRGRVLGWSLGSTAGASTSAAHLDLGSSRDLGHLSGRLRRLAAGFFARTRFAGLEAAGGAGGRSSPCSFDSDAFAGRGVRSTIGRFALDGSSTPRRRSVRR